MGEDIYDKYESSIAFKTHVQRFCSAHDKHASYCQSQRNWVGTVKAGQAGLVTALLRHFHTVTHKRALLSLPPVAFHAAASHALTAGVKSAGGERGEGVEQRNFQLAVYTNGLNQMVIQFRGMRPRFEAADLWLRVLMISAKAESDLKRKKKTSESRS